jgi:hypothetical protein
MALPDSPVGGSSSDDSLARMLEAEFASQDGDALSDISSDQPASKRHKTGKTRRMDLVTQILQASPNHNFTSVPPMP